MTPDTAPQLRLDGSRASIKKASADPTFRPKRALGWSEVLAVLSTSEARSFAIAQYRAAGFTPDDFGRLRAARVALCDALTTLEDKLEVQSIESRAGRGERDAERARIRDVRRRLEQELWP